MEKPTWFEGQLTRRWKTGRKRGENDLKGKNSYRHVYSESLVGLVWIGHVRKGREVLGQKL
jgi:hypothetical protein